MKKYFLLLGTVITLAAFGCSNAQRSSEPAGGSESEDTMIIDDQDNVLIERNDSDSITNKNSNLLN